MFELQRQGIDLVVNDDIGTRMRASTRHARRRRRETGLGRHAHLKVFDTTNRRLADADTDSAQALADMATTSILHHRLPHRATTIAEQLEHALHSRVTIEQAKGILSERLHIDIPGAFALLRAQQQPTGQRRRSKPSQWHPARHGPHRRITPDPPTTAPLSSPSQLRTSLTT